MTGTLTDYWDAIRPQSRSANTSSISPNLISAESLHHLSEVGQHFPRVLGNLAPFSIASLVGFECRLSESQPQADLFLRVVPDTGGRDILAGSQAVETQAKFYHLLAGSRTIPELSPPLINHPVWQKVRLFSIQWSTQNTAFYNNIKDLWLEFYLKTDPPNIPIPSVFLGPKAAHCIKTGLNILLNHPLNSEQQ